jgi:hypothetical protein
MVSTPDVSGSVNVEVMSESAQVGSNAQKLSMREKKLERGEVLVRMVGLV